MSIQPFTRPALITFDAMDTLIEPSQSVGRWYREALNAVGDMRLRLPRPGLFTAAFNKVFADMCKSDPCFGAKSGTSSRDWWYQVVKKTFQTTENLHTQIDEDELESIMPELFELVYEEVRDIRLTFLRIIYFYQHVHIHAYIHAYTKTHTHMNTIIYVKTAFLFLGLFFSYICLMVGYRYSIPRRDGS